MASFTKDQLLQKHNEYKTKQFLMPLVWGLGSLANLLFLLLSTLISYWFLIGIFVFSVFQLVTFCYYSWYSFLSIHFRNAWLINHFKAGDQVEIET